MTLFWPGDHLAGGTFSETHLLEAVVAAEAAWLAVLVDARIAPTAARADLEGLIGPDDLPRLAVDAATGGNPVIPVVALLRESLAVRGDTDAARWLHRGLTSQDVLDTALIVMAVDVWVDLRIHLRRVVDTLATLADAHRTSRMVGRTLTQPAVPITFGAKVAGWLHGVLDAVDQLDQLEFPAQCGGAAGTLSGVTVLTGGDGRAALTLAAAFADRLLLVPAAPWHTHRTPVTRFGEAVARCTAACGRIANDVLTLNRPEIGELGESAGGGSSTMPQKANPTRSVSIRRAALSAPAHLSLLHLAAADTRDERPDGAWHAEWQPLHLLARHALTAVVQTRDLVDGLRVDTFRMAENLAAAADVDAEAQALGDLLGSVPAWAGADDALIDAAVARAAAWQETDA